MQLDLLAVDTGNEKRKGRPPIHADSAARKRAHRAEKARVDYSDDPAIVAKLQEIAAELGYSNADVLRSMVRFALTNRDWKRLGLTHQKAH